MAIFAYIWDRQEYIREVIITLQFKDTIIRDTGSTYIPLDYHR